ncbi:Hypothetical predicted protein [Xyrichtys novacula]|uniref:HAT C-terminal dimerisation domain-containing protein n=1 Tax=Xyrichtys novacula TaxID=13765 RepID=A0AAV1FKG3_XYRNO|nr:Hypothetical predicted protein [Xyrichtys novacula]
MSGFDPEDLIVDVGYWFKGSTNRKGDLAEFCDFHGSEYMETLLHISVRWLSLEMFITRVLWQSGPLTSYFKSLNESQPRFRRLVDAFSNPMTEVYLLFFQSVLPVFSALNLLLQRGKSSIFLLHGEEQDKVSEEFLDYQLMDIPMPQDPTTFNVEEFWGSMSSTKSKVTGLRQFGRLSKIAALVLVLPHSNADAERVFSMVGLNKTKTRNSLALDGTLSSIMTVKMASLEPQCFKWEPPTPVLKASNLSKVSERNQGWEEDRERGSSEEVLGMTQHGKVTDVWWFGNPEWSLSGKQKMIRRGGRLLLRKDPPSRKEKIYFPC